MAGNNVVIQWNIRGARKNKTSLDILIAEHDPAAISLQETKLTPLCEPDFILNGYTPYFKSNDDGQWGVATFVKNDIIQSRVDLTTELQSIAVHVTIRGKAYTIWNHYTPHSTNPHISEYHQTTARTIFFHCIS